MGELSSSGGWVGAGDGGRKGWGQGGEGGAGREAGCSPVVLPNVWPSDSSVCVTWVLVRKVAVSQALTSDLLNQPACIQVFQMQVQSLSPRGSSKGHFFHEAFLDCLTSELLHHFIIQNRSLGQVLRGGRCVPLSGFDRKLLESRELPALSLYLPRAP